MNATEASQILPWFCIYIYIYIYIYMQNQFGNNLNILGFAGRRKGRESEGVDTVLSAVGRAGSFNPEEHLEQRSFLFWPFEPSLRKERLRSERRLGGGVQRAANR